MSKRAGKHSQQANDFLQPLAPTSVVATDVGTGRAYNDGAASVAFSLPVNSQPATSYTVTASTGQTAVGSSSPITIGGLASNATPTFTVTATNSYGNSPASSASSAITITTVPNAPDSVSASSPSGATYDTITWNAPNNGGKAITTYHVTGNDGTSGDTTSTSINISQGAGETQAYTVYATNANGNSAASASSGSVTTFSFVPFSVFSFFGVFSFTPFSVFGFVPFSVFGFVPFSVFAFFGVFGFTPFSVFSFAPAFHVFGFR
jgi:hypothetical protein